MKGRHRIRESRAALGVTATLAALAVVAAGGWFGYREYFASAGGASCGEPVALTVGVAPELVAPVEAAAIEWLGTGPRVADRCVTVDVTAADPADVSAAIAGRGGLALSGLGPAPGQLKVPDVWLPDSSIWLHRLRAGGDVVPADAPSVARSPVVLAVPEPIARTLGWPNAKPTWTDLLRRMGGGTPLRTGIVEPARDAAGLAGLLAVASAAGSAGGANAQQTTVGALRSLANGRAAVREEVLRRFPRNTDAASLASGLAAAPLTEQTVVAYNATQPAVALAALYVEPAAAPLDYPYTVMPGLTDEQVEAAGRLRGALAGTAFRDRLGAAGFRAPDGSTGRGFVTPAGAPAGPGPAPSPAPELTLVERLLSTWSAVTLPARMLAVIDVSGSMLRTVPTAGNATRMQVTLEAARRGLGLFDDSWSLGVWTFSTQLDGPRDYKELVPVGPLATQRPALQAALTQIRPKANGNTGLYDTILAGYKAVQDGWEPGRINSLVVMTDGENDDADGITLEALLGELQKIKDANRPVQVILIAIGPDVGPEKLKQITDTAGGGTFAAPDPAKIGDIFLQAIALRSGAVPK